jgi:L-aminopeptidase/D-esterase-like protein
VADTVHAVTLSGGSAFGLSASGGVLRYLEERGVGLDVFYAKVPVVPSAIIFDLGIGDATVRPDEEMGYRAAAGASTDERSQGSVGAGCGASVGKLFGTGWAMKGGLGTASESIGDVIVGVLVVVNAFGDVLDWETGRLLAGTRDPEHPENLIDTARKIRLGLDRAMPPGQNTTLAVVATNVALTKSGAVKLAQMAQSSLARVISPIHSTFDGDIVFALSVRDPGGSKGDSVKAGINTLALLGERALFRAVKRAIVHADGRGVVPSYQDMQT